MSSATRTTKRKKILFELLCKSGVGSSGNRKLYFISDNIYLVVSTKDIYKQIHEKRKVFALYNVA